MWKKKNCLFAITLIIALSCEKNNVVSGNFSFLVTGLWSHATWYLLVWFKE